MTRRHFLAASAASAVPWPYRPAAQASPYVPPPESEGGWRRGDPASLGVDGDRLAAAIRYHDEHPATTSYGGAIVVLRDGHVIGESYVTGRDGGPRRWTAATCNDVKSSTKSVFGTAVGVFLDEHRGRVDLDTRLVGSSRDDSLIPEIWEQPLTDDRKRDIRVRHVLSMTSGHESREPWLAPTPRHHYEGYRGPFQMYEYCFGWWRFEDIPDHHRLKFAPGADFNYSNYGLEQMALAMRHVTGERLGPYTYERVLGPIGFPVGIRDNGFRDMPYSDGRELNFAERPGWGVGGSEGCDAYGADKSASPIGYNEIAGSTFRCSARDFARLGYLWLHRGRWGGRQLVSEEWMRLATSRHVRADGSSPMPYGYTFWIQDGWDGVPSDTFSSRGHNMNDCHVVPSLDLVVARLGNDNPPRAERSEFVETYMRRIVAAIRA